MWIDVENARVFAQTGGQSFNSGKQSVVLIHGAGMDQTVWQQQSRYLAHHGWNVFAIDMPGHGASEGSAPYSVRAGAEWLVSLLDALDLPRVSLVGHSLGALMSLEAAGRFAERVDKLALLGISAEMPVHQDLLDAAKANEPAWSEKYRAMRSTRPRAKLSEWGTGKGGLHLRRRNGSTCWRLLFPSFFYVLRVASSRLGAGA